MPIKIWNPTRLRAALYPGFAFNRKSQLTAVIKDAYRIDVSAGGPYAPLIPLLKVPPIVEVDRYRGDPTRSSLLDARESMPFKWGGEWYMQNALLRAAPGKAVARGSVTVLRADEPSVTIELTAFGRRRWEGKLLPRLSDPEPLDAVPLDLEHAYGGIDETVHPNKREYVPNPGGMGYNGEEAPQLEEKPFITKPEDRPTPATVCALPVTVESRALEQGAIDDQPSTAGCQYAKDAKETMHNYGSPRQRFAERWQGGETVTVTSIFPNVPYGQPVSFILPAFRPEVVLKEGNLIQHLQPAFDTFWIDAERCELYVLSRVGIPWRMTEPRMGWVYVREQATDEVSPPLMTESV